MSRFWKCMIALVALIVIAAISAPIVLIARFAGRGREVEAEIARIKAEGAPVNAADLAGKPIPDSENAAVICEKAFKYLPKQLDSPDRNTLYDVLSTEKRSANPKLWARADAVVKHYAPALALAEKAATMPKCRFKVDWSDPLKSEFNYRAPLRFLSLLACSRAVLKAKAGDAHGAVESIELAIHLSDSLRQEPTLMDALVRYALIRYAASTIEDASQHCVISEKDARHIGDVLGMVDLRNSLQAAFKGERAQGMIVFNNNRHGMMLDNEEAYFLQEMRYRIAKAPQPYRILAGQTWKDEPEEPRYAVFGPMLLGPGLSTTAGRDGAIAALAGSQIFLGLLIYHDHFGSYPAKLDEVKMKLNWEVPEDPFSGKPFLYRRKGSGFILYSIDYDLKDNGGINCTENKPGDIVWKLDH